MSSKEKLTRSEAGRKGGLARAKAFTREYQRSIRKKLSSEAAARNGAKGAAVTIERHGQAMLFEKSRQHRLKNPSKPELLMIGILSTLKIEFEREYQPGDQFLYLDFYLPEHHKAIEVHGRIHKMVNVEERQRNDERKRELLAELGIECLWIGHEELADVEALVGKIRKFVAGSLEAAA